MISTHDATRANNAASRRIDNLQRLAERKTMGLRLKAPFGLMPPFIHVRRKGIVPERSSQE